MPQEGSGEFPVAAVQQSIAGKTSGSWRGACLGRFVAVEAVGAGSMGVVLVAYDPELDRRVALKLMRLDRHRHGESLERARLRLQREAQAMARLSHPNVVTVFDVGTVDEQVYVAMEYVQGETLRTWLRREPRSWRQVVDMFVAAGRGLAAAHAAGIVHRDFKPDNVLVGADQRPRVSDFGLASTSGRALDELPAGPPAPGALPAPVADADRETFSPSDLERSLTVRGALVGTPFYMAPEQHDGAGVGPAADQFAFCVALYEGLYGERPFRSEGYWGLLVQVKQGRVREPPRRVKVPPWLRQVVVRGLRPHPGDRYPDMNALLAALTRDRVAVRRRVGGAVAAALIGGLVAWGAVGARPGGGQPCTDAQARERLTGVWDPAVRGRAQKAFLAPGGATAAAGGARATFDRVARRLDGYAGEWAAMHTEACRATRVRGEQSEELLDRRMACLERRRGKLAALTEVLARADAAVIARSLPAAHDLEPVRDCADATALLAQVAPPGDPTIARRVSELHPQLDRLHMALDLGVDGGKLAEAKRLVREADATGYGPVRVRAHGLLGEAHLSSQELEAAERELLEMSRIAAEARDDKILPRTLGRLAVVYQVTNRHEQALAMVRAAEVAARRVSDDISLGYAQVTAAVLLGYLGRHEEARAAAQGAFAALEKHTRAEEQVALIYPMVHLAAAFAQQGRVAEAYSLNDKARVIAVAVYGVEHQRAIALARSTAIYAQQAGDVQRARALLDGALAELSKLGRVDENDTAQVLVDQAFMEERLGNYQRAEELLRRGLELIERTNQPSQWPRGMIYLARMRLRQGRYQDAEEIYQRVLERVHRSDLDHTDSAYVGLANLRQRQRRFHEGREYLDKAESIRRKIHGPDTMNYGLLLSAMAGLEVAAGRCPHARPKIDQARTLLASKVGPDHYVHAEPLALEARCAVAAGRATDAIAPAERALAILEKARLAPARLGEARFLRARALWDTDRDRARALTEAERAETELAAGGDDTRNDLAELRAWRRSHADLRR